jgi:hypothetical protein
MAKAAINQSGVMWRIGVKIETSAEMAASAAAWRRK